MLNTHRVQSAPSWARALLESATIAGTTLTCFLVIPAIRSLVRPDLNYVPLPFDEPFLAHVQVAILMGLVGLAIRLFISGPRSILYSFLIPFVAMLLWAFDQQNLFVNPDLWKLVERGWFTAALLAGLAGLLFALGVHGISRLLHLRQGVK